MDPNARSEFVLSCPGWHGKFCDMNTVRQTRQMANCTPAEYFVLEAAAEERHDYVDGLVVAMAGGTIRHSLVIANVIGEFRSKLRGSPCRVYDSNLKIKARQYRRYRYPDLSIICGQVEIDPDDPTQSTATNPRVLIEITSEATERDDRGAKFQDYVSIASLEEYVIIAQHQPRVETLLRQTDGTWSLSWAEGLPGMVRIRSLNLDISLQELYEGVTFDEPPAEVDAPKSDPQA